MFVTAGEHGPQRIFEGYEAGAVDFLTKPIDPRILRHKVDTFLELYRQRRELSDALRLNEMFVATLGHDLIHGDQSGEVGAVTLVTGEPAEAM